MGLVLFRRLMVHVSKRQDLVIDSLLPLLQTQGRESIAAKLVANLITEAGANRVLACDLHSGQAMGYFDIPVDHVYGQVSLQWMTMVY
jgi:hypothetical protein